MLVRGFVIGILAGFLALATLANAWSFGHRVDTEPYMVAFHRYVETTKIGLPQGMITAAASSAPVGGVTSIPYGWADFCGRRPEQCSVPALSAMDLKLTRKAWHVLERVNREVNGFIVPISNLQHWGTTLDHWDYPVDGKGDCKTYALFKRKLLLDAGFPRQALLMTIVRDLDGEGHTILMVKTGRGDFILDNLVNRIRPWNATGYYFLKRQSQTNPNVWLSINLRGIPAPLSVTYAR